MAKNLLIVESPAKAKTIEKFLGKDFTVKSSYGHVRDLVTGELGIDIEHGFEPEYIVPDEKKKVVKDLKQSVSKAEVVWLATDEDREGEAISWHLCKVLGLDEETTKRIVFREITKPAIQKAVEQPRKLDIDLVYAQQARRVLDRLVGFKLSEILWRKVKGKLSAGRVQSVAVKLVVEREREINAFTPEPYFKIAGLFTPVDENKPFKAERTERMGQIEDAEAFISACKNATFTVGSIETKPVRRKPAPPFITSTLQQEASRKLGFSVQRTMNVAQKLYEAGHITYMRTDSTNLSNLALGSIADEVASSYGKEYVKTRQFKSKNSSAQEAHEAIRPTYIDRREVDGDRDAERLYDLIWKRTIASQMAEAELERTKAEILISTLENESLEATGEVLKFDGFLKVYTESSDDENGEDTSDILPPLSTGQNLDLIKMEGTEKFTRPPARYTEAMLVKKLEEMGIGRPSTYAPTITRIMNPSRGYITKESRPGTERSYRIVTLENGEINKREETEITGAQSNRLFPSDIGMVVTDFLEEHFREIMDYSFTADIEEQFDTIAEGSLRWDEMIEHFYNPFSENVETTIQEASRARGKRILGTDENTNHTILVQMTKYGPVVQIGTREEVGEEGKPQFANLRPGQSMETITLEEALELFQLPKTLGNYKDEEVSVGVGRYGPYVKHGDSFVSLAKGEDPLEVDLDRAIELIKAKQQENQPVGYFREKPITKGKGRFGPYLKWNEIYVNVPRKMNFDDLSDEEMHELIKAKIEKEANRYIQRWESEKLAIENGRWGPFIRSGRKSISFPKINGKKVTQEIASELSLDEVKMLVKGEVPEKLKLAMSDKAES